MAIGIGRLKIKETIILPIIRERDASRGILKGFTIASKISIFRESQISIDRTEEVCIRWTRTRRKISPIERRKKSTFDAENWWISLNNSVKTGPVRDRSDFNDALTTLKRLHQESGEQQLRPVPFWKYQKWHQSLSFSSNGAIPGGAHDN